MSELQLFAPPANEIDIPVDCFTAEDVAKRLQIPKKRVYKLCRDGYLKFINTTPDSKRPQYRIPRQALADYLNDYARAKTPDTKEYTHLRTA